ncbi:GNAT family N-acetyltransferase [Desulfopila sp. IMCC35008]|uniref:GNAT family N-acetyltransferase n=1 Tax=Desulfopila sp. IMCC35008 TaxID=2653858 RepID=UPI0013D4251B|nr:GNAT family N-acetyltransferase [Desulfopila sp. IMCC35008]
MDIKPFKGEHISDASVLFRKGYAKLRSRFPYLPDKVEKTEWITEKLSGIVEKHPGFVAIRANEVVGYMIGYPVIQELKGSQTGAYVPEWGNATARENSEDICTSLYRAISESWIDVRSYNHIISFLVNENIIETMSLLGFGMQVIDAGRNLSQPRIETKPDVVIEIGTEKHIYQLQEIDHLINVHLEAAPCFLKRCNEIKDAGDIRKDFFSQDVITVVATKGDKVVSCIRGRMHHGNTALLHHKNVFGINFGYTRQEYRNSKIATAVLSKAIEVASGDGASMCSVDFEPQNVAARYFWLSHFSPIIYSFIRKVDDRI